MQTEIIVITFLRILYGIETQLRLSALNKS